MPIRTATDADSSAIRHVVFTVLREYDLEPDPEDTDADLADVQASYFERGGMFAVLEENGEVVGTVGLYPLDKTHCELRKMYLLASQRGRGHGRALAEYALQAARSLGFTRVSLETTGRLETAIALYRKLGFREVAAGDHIATRCDQAFFLELSC